MIKKLVKINLPSEYQQVEYLESTGTQYIDTGFIPNRLGGFEIEWKLTSSPSGKDFRFGCAQTTNGTLFQLNYDASNASINYWGLGEGVLYIDKVISKYAERFVNSYVVGNEVKIDDVLVTTYERTNTNNKSFYLFARNNNGVVQYPTVGCQIRKVKLYNGNEVANCLIPCYRKSDNVAGMYDVVTDTFFTNAGSGEFIVGNKFVGNKTETVVTNRDRPNIDTITESTTIEYCEKEHIDYDGSELTKEITITRPCKLYLGFECKNSEQITGGIVPMPYSLNYEIKIGNTIYDSGKPNATKIGGDFEYVLLDITEDILPYTTTISIYAHVYPNHPLADFKQVIHLYSDIYYTVGEIEVMKKIKAIKRYVGGELKDITKINKIVNGEVKTINI